MRSSTPCPDTYGQGGCKHRWYRWPYMSRPLPREGSRANRWKRQLCACLQDIRCPTFSLLGRDPLWVRDCTYERDKICIDYLTIPPRKEETSPWSEASTPSSPPESPSEGRLHLGHCFYLPSTLAGNGDTQGLLSRWKAQCVPCWFACDRWIGWK